MRLTKPLSNRFTFKWTKFRNLNGTELVTPKKDILIILKWRLDLRVSLLTDSFIIVCSLEVSDKDVLIVNLEYILPRWEYCILMK